MKKILLSKWLWIVIVLLGAGAWWFLGRGESAPEYETVAVERATITEIVDASGEVEPETYADIAFAMSGAVEEVLVEREESVERFDVLAQIDAASYHAALAQAQAAARIAEANERLARRDWDDLQPEEREAKKLASEQARQAAAAAAANVEKTYLRAPFDGMVTRIDIREGEFAAAGATVARVSQNHGALRITADIPESDIAKLSVGQEGEAVFDAFGPREKYPVKLVEIEPEANAIRDVVYYTVYFDILSDEPRLRSGMSTDIEIRVAEARDTLSLPFRAVWETEDRVYVEVFGADGISIVEREVEIGLEDDEGNIEILSGLAEGEEVIVRSKKEL